MTVKTAAELLARVREDPGEIDLVVMDLRLPNSGGVEMVRALRRIDEARRVPLLVFSGTIASADEVRDLASLGVAGYVNEYSATDSTSSPRWRRISSPTVSTGGAARASFSASRSRTGSATRSPQL